jgi:hypothetical protein
MTDEEYEFLDKTHEDYFKGRELFKTPMSIVISLMVAWISVIVIIILSFI